MKKIFIIFVTYLLSTTISSAALSQWTKVVESQDGYVSYIDFNKLKIVNDFVYFWELEDFPYPHKDGTMSLKTYHQVDCSLNAVKYHKYASYNLSMGEGNPIDIWSRTEKKWKTPKNGSVLFIRILKVCNFVKN